MKNAGTETLTFFKLSVTRLDEIESLVQYGLSHSPKWRHHYFVFIITNSRPGDLPGEETVDIKADETIKLSIVDFRQSSTSG